MARRRPRKHRPQLINATVIRTERSVGKYANDRGFKAMRSKTGKLYFKKKVGDVKYVVYKKGSRIMQYSYHIKNPGRRKRRGYDSFSLSKGYHNWARS